MQRGFLLRKPAAPTTQAPNATEPKGDVAQLATPQATTQENYVAQLASAVLLNNATELALCSDNEAVLCACRGLDVQSARCIWNYFAQLLSADLPASFPPGDTPTFQRPLQEWRARKMALDAQAYARRLELRPYDTGDWRPNPEHIQEHVRILYPFSRRLLYAVDEHMRWNPHSWYSAEESDDSA